MDDNNYEEKRKIIDERLGILQMPTDAKGRIITIVVLVIALVTIWFMLEVVIVTFILTFVFYYLHKYTMRGLAKTPFRIIPGGIVLLLLYVGVIALFVLFAMYNTPLIVEQITQIGRNFGLFNFRELLEDIDPNLVELANQINIDQYLGRIGQAIMSGLASVGEIALNFLLSDLKNTLLRARFLAVAGTEAGVQTPISMAAGF